MNISEYKPVMDYDFSTFDPLSHLNEDTDVDTERTPINSSERTLCDFEIELTEFLLSKL